MFKRVMVAVVGLPLLILILGWAPSWATMLLLAAMCAIGAWELMHAAAGEKGQAPDPPDGDRRGAWFRCACIWRSPSTTRS